MVNSLNVATVSAAKPVTSSKLIRASPFSFLAELDTTDAGVVVDAVREYYGITATSEEKIHAHLKTLKAFKTADKVKIITANLGNLGFDMPPYANLASAVKNIAVAIASGVVSVDICSLILLLLPLALNVHSDVIAMKLRANHLVWTGPEGLDVLFYLQSCLLTLLVLVAERKPFTTIRPFFALKRFPQLHENVSVLYDVCSPLFKQHYIGRTNCPTRRLHEHVRDSFSPKQLLHKFLHKNGAHSFALIPLFETKNAVAEEARLIKRGKFLLKRANSC